MDLPQPVLMELMLTGNLMPIERLRDLGFVNDLGETPDAVRAKGAGAGSRHPRQRAAFRGVRQAVHPGRHERGVRCRPGNGLAHPSSGLRKRRTKTNQDSLCLVVTV